MTNMENNNYQNLDNITVTAPSFEQVTPPKKRRGGNAMKFVALAVGCSLAGGIVGAGCMCVVDTMKDKVLSRIEQPAETDAGKTYEGQRETKPLNMNYVDTGKEMTPAEIYAANVNSTVGITTSVKTNYFGYTTMAAAAGSGLILSDDGYIITNYHVVEDAEEIKVATYDDKVYEAKLIGCDEENDLAVLKIDAKGLTPVVLGDSDKLNVGDSVVAIGNPLGELTFSLTQGAVSALNRSITIGTMSMNLIQTDCAINSGNSGGALFNSYGEVIGITNAKYSGDTSSASVDNIGFAIPINSVRDLITSIIEKGYVEKAYIGVKVYDIDSRRSQFQGAAVYSVEEGSPADKAGILPNDIITAVNGDKITGYQQLRSALAAGKAGDEFELTINRDGEEIKVKVTLAVYKKSALKDTRDT